MAPRTTGHGKVLPRLADRAVEMASAFGLDTGKRDEDVDPAEKRPGPSEIFQGIYTEASGAVMDIIVFFCGGGGGHSL